MERKQEQLNRCPDARSLLPEYVEGELGAGDRARLAGHLDICSGCRREEAHYRRALGTLSSPRESILPGDLYPGFVAKLDAIELRHRWRAPQLRLAAAAACLLLVVAVGAVPVIRFLRPAKPAPVLVTPVPPNEVVVSPPALPIAPNRNRESPKTVVQDPFAPGQIITGDNERRMTTRRNPRRLTQRRPENTFWAVQPKYGRSAGDQIAEGAAIDRGAERAWKTLGAGFIEDRNDRVQVGEKVLRIQTGYKLDDEGRRSVVSVKIDSSTLAKLPIREKEKGP